MFAGTDVSTRFTTSDLPAGTLQVGVWQYFTFTYDHGTADVYKDGTLLASKSGMDAPSTWGGLSISAMAGTVDELELDDTALTAAQVQSRAQLSAPGTPTALTATAGAEQVSLAWTGSAGTDTYDVYRGTSVGGEGYSIYQSGITGTRFVDTNVSTQSTYYYTVVAEGPGGQSSASSEVSATPLARATPVLEWDLDDGSGSTAADSSGNGYTGTLSGGPTWTTGVDGTGGLSFASGQTLTNTSFPDPGDAFTVSFWIKPSSLADNTQVVGAVNGWGAFNFHIVSGGAIYAGTDVATRFTPSDLGTGTMQANVWQHFAFTFDNGTADIYKNGTLIASKTGMDLPGTWGGFGVNGVVGAADEVRVYNRALSPQEVAALSGASQAPTDVNALAADAGTARVSWVDNSLDETGFTIQDSTDGGTTWTTVGTTNANATATYVSASPGSSNSYRVISDGTTGGTSSSSATLVMPSGSGSGYYRVSLGSSAMSQGETIYSLAANHFQLQNGYTGAFLAASPVAAIEAAVVGSTTVAQTGVTYDFGGASSASSAYQVGTTQSLTTQIGATGQSFDLGGAPYNQASNQYLITLEDTTGTSGPATPDEDYDDWYLPVTVTFIPTIPILAPVDGSCPTRVYSRDGAASTSPAQSSSSGSDGPQDGGVVLSSGFAVDDSASSGVAGPGTMLADEPSLVQDPSGMIAAVNGPEDLSYYTFAGGSYSAGFGDLSQLIADASHHEYQIVDPKGTISTYNDFTTGSLSGRIKSQTDPAGNATNYTYDGNGKLTEKVRTTVTGTVTTQESFDYSYLTSGSAAGQLASVTLRRKSYDSSLGQTDASTSYAEVQETDYTYYASGDAHGNAGQLETVITRDADGTATDVNLYRYYTGESGGASGALKYIVGDASYARLNAALPSGTTALTATDTQLAPYADNAYTYDSQGRISTSTAQGAGCSSCAGGLGTTSYTYARSGNAIGYNSWATKTVATLPDGTVNTYYYNGYGQQMLGVTTDATTSISTGTFTKYDSAGRAVLNADAAAVQLPSSLSTLEAYPDLLNSVSGNYQYLSDTTGEISTIDYAASTTATGGSAGNVAGYEEDSKLQHGETGTPILQESLDYQAHTGAGATVYPVADDTVYGNSDGTDARTTSYIYTWYAGSTQPQTVMTELPEVASGQNGPGVADTESTFYDAYGRPIWMKDGNGNISYTAYDDATGAVVKQITSVVYDDLTAAEQSSFNTTGWAHPTTGQNLVTTYAVDDRGRTTKMISPNGNITYTVYDDADREVRTYPGFNATTGTPTGPIQITRGVLPAANSGGLYYTETMTSSATPHLTGGVPDGTESLDASNIQSLQRDFTNAAGQVLWSDKYASLSGVTFSEGVTLSGGAPADLGTSGTNYYRTTYAYDVDGRENKVVAPTGTITRTVYDGIGDVISTWVGTSDTPTSGYWSPANNAGSNMTEVASYAYDNGGAGDHNLTEETQYPGLGQSDRVTDYAYDWRNRLVEEKDGSQASESTSDNSHPIKYWTYDNLGEATEQDSYDGDGVQLSSLGSTNGVPNAPSSSLLRARSTRSYDDQGRVYQASTYSVDPSSGTVGSAITSNTFYDHAGNTIATYASGQPTMKYVYDGANRVVTAYTTDGGSVDNSGSPLMSWSNAGSVSNDVVVSETGTAYDADSNPILTTTKDRLATADGTTAGALTSSDARLSYVADYYDAADRPIAEEDAGTNAGSAWTPPTSPDAGDDTHLVTTYGYDAAGNRNLTTDPRGFQSLSVFDMLGRTTKTIAAYTNGTPTSSTNQTTTYTYDGDGNVLSMTALMPTGTPSQTTAYVYGTGSSSGVFSNDLLAKTEYPDATTGAASTAASDDVSYTYDALGELHTSVDQNGTTHTYSYDVLGRQTLDSVAVASGNPENVDTYVLAIGTNYNTQGLPYQQTSYSDAAGTTVVNQDQDVYNGFGQLTGEYQAISGAVNVSTTPEVQYAYSGASLGSRLTSMTYPNGRVLDYNYNTGLDSALSRVSSLADAAGSGAGNLQSYSYQGLSTILGETDGNGVTETTTLDTLGRTAEMKYVNNSSVTTDDFAYGYDRDSNVLYKNNLLNSSESELYHANSTTAGDSNTAYDSLNRLTGFERGALSASGNNGTTLDAVTSPSENQNWSLDAVGNQLSVTTSGTTTSNTTNAKNELTANGASSLTFDHDGNTTTDDAGHTYGFDGWNRLAVAKSGDTTLASYQYDAGGRRIADTTTGQERYYNGSWQEIEDRASGGTATNQYVWSNSGIRQDLVLQDDNSTGGSYGAIGSGLGRRLFVQQDANSDVTSLDSSSGTVVQRYAYDAYGATTTMNSSWTPTTDGYGWGYSFQDARVESATDLLNFRHREYSTSLERWLQHDPAGYVDGSNPYLFEVARPVDMRDPTGLTVISVDLSAGAHILMNGVNGTMSLAFAQNSDGDFDLGIVVTGGSTIGVGVQFGTGIGVTASSAPSLPSSLFDGTPSLTSDGSQSAAADGAAPSSQTNAFDDGLAPGAALGPYVATPAWTVSGAVDSNGYASVSTSVGPSFGAAVGQQVTISHTLISIGTATWNFVKAAVSSACHTAKGNAEAQGASSTQVDDTVDNTTDTAGGVTVDDDTRLWLGK